jgi:hypothetical protein
MPGLKPRAGALSVGFQLALNLSLSFMIRSAADEKAQKICKGILSLSYNWIDLLEKRKFYYWGMPPALLMW